MSAPNVLIAPDKFKGSLTAMQVAERIVAGIQRVEPDAACTILPLADGGDGSVAAACAAGFVPRTLGVTGPTGERLEAVVAVRDDTAVVEAATICGLAVLPGGTLAPLRASSVGIGEAIATLAADGIRRIVVALGGSATTDGGAGMLHGLGARLLDAHGRPIAPSGGTLADVRGIDRDGMLRLDGIELVAATDVRNPLLGELGAARVFGPQKGASDDDVRRLEQGLATLVAALGGSARDAACAAGAGSAGGLGFALLHIGGRVVSGADHFLDLLDFDRHAATADLVVTGEGSLDAQTAHGKLIAVVAQRSSAAVVAVVGRSTLDAAAAAALGLADVVAISALTDRDTLHDPALSADLVADAAAGIARSHLRRRADLST